MSFLENQFEILGFCQKPQQRGGGPNKTHPANFVAPMARQAASHANGAGDSRRGGLPTKFAGSFLCGPPGFSPAFCRNLVFKTFLRISIKITQ